MEQNLEIKENGITLRTAIPLLANNGDERIAELGMSTGKGTWKPSSGKNYTCGVLS